MLRASKVTLLLALLQGLFLGQECPLSQEETVKLACSPQPMKSKIDAVRQRGVDFEIDLTFAKNLNAKCGQQVELIRTIETSYKKGCTAEVSLPDGPPLTKHQVVLLLDAKVDQGTIGRLIERRKVDFSISADVTKELQQAGAGRDLIGSIVLNGVK